MKVIIANFKSNLTMEQIQNYFLKLDSYLECTKLDSEVFVLPPSFALNLKVKNFIIGAQNAYPAEKGAYTGEITLQGLLSLGIQTVMIGHSERRSMGENTAICWEKFHFYQEHGFKIIYCIGEDLSTHEHGMESIKAYLSSQLPPDLNYDGLYLAYEPIWAIGTGVSAKTDEIAQIHSFLRSKTKAPLLYGGSVSQKNIKEILEIPNVDGALIGSASLDVDSFITIIKS